MSATKAMIVFVASISSAVSASRTSGPVLRAEKLPSTSTTIGALFVGWGISMLVFGIFCLQTFMYYSRYTTDSSWLKLFVAILWFMEVGHQVAVGTTCWPYIVKDYGSLIEVFSGRTVWGLGVVVVLGVTVAAIVKIFLGWRVYKVSGKKAWVIVISISAVTQQALAIGFAGQALNIPVAEFIKLTTLPTIALSLGAATDVIIALVLSFYLHRMRTGFRRSERLIDRLIIFSVNTGALTSAFSLSVVILFQTMPDNFVFICIYFLVCKLYSNSCLATLNSRKVKRPDADDRTRSTGFNVAMMSFLRPRSHNVPVDVEAGDHTQSAIRIGMHHERVVAHESDGTSTGLGTESGFTQSKIDSDTTY